MAIDWKLIPDEVDTSVAPFDGEEVLIFADSATVDVVRLAWWDAGEEDFMGRPKPEDRGWWSYRHSVTQEHLDFLEPSHWAPFEAPKRGG